MFSQDREREIQALINHKGPSLEAFGWINNSINFPRDVINGIRSKRSVDFRPGEATGTGLTAWFLYNGLVYNSIGIFNPDFYNLGVIVDHPHVTIPYLVGPALGLVAGLVAKEARVGRAIRKTKNIA